MVQDLFLTETAFHADVVLPASAFAEKSGSFTNTDRRVQIARPVIPPPGDARQDWWIIAEIAKRMGLGWDYAGPADIFAEMAQTMPSFANITWERLQREGAVTYPVDGPDQPGNEIIFATGFPTASGRACMVPASVMPPDEIPDDEYPMVLSSDRDVPEGMVFMPFCYAEAAANLLTNPALDPYGKIPEFKFCAARVSPLEEMATAAE